MTENEGSVVVVTRAVLSGQLPGDLAVKYQSTLRNLESAEHHEFVFASLCTIS